MHSMVELFEYLTSFVLTNVIAYEPRYDQVQNGDHILFIVTFIRNKDENAHQWWKGRILVPGQAAIASRYRPLASSLNF
jgi:hypothetical protein